MHIKSYDYGTLYFGFASIISYGGSKSYRVEIINIQQKWTIRRFQEAMGMIVTRNLACDIFGY